MSSASDMRSGKGSSDENFPVASWLVAPRHRRLILAFYDFARAADDVGDHPTLDAATKLAMLDQMARTLQGHDDIEPAALPLRLALAERGLSPRHGLDLLVAFKRDCTKNRYDDWAELMDYCRYSANPVGRFVLDVHGESEELWPVNDALCSALQIINHLQDCAKDYREIDRVYVPRDALAAEGLDVSALAAARATPALRHCLSQLALRTDHLLDVSEAFAGRIRDSRLACEVAVIQRLARRLVGLLRDRDPLSERVHLSKPQMAATALRSVLDVAAMRLFGASPPPDGRIAS